MTTATYTRPPLYEQQAAFVDAPERYVVVEASTKTGKTVGMLVWITEQAMQAQPGQHCWWVAPVYPQAEVAFRRLKRFLPRQVFESNESKLTITLANQVTIWFKSGEKPDNLYGEDVVAAVIDEATRLRQEAWHAIRSTLTATRGRVRIIGNVKGRRNWAFDLARLAETGAPEMRHFKLTAWDAVSGGILQAAEVEDAQRMLPDAVFRELYLAEPSDDEGNPFNLSAIRACLGELSQDDPAAWGWDLAKHQDWTVGIALDQMGRVCRLERWQATWRATTADIKHLTRSAPALVDSTGVGDPVLENLQQGGQENFQGFKFTPSSKQQLMEGLALAIHQGELTFPKGVLTIELEAFQYEVVQQNGRVTGVRYSAPSNMHDDCVMALALARQCWIERGRAASQQPWVDFVDTGAESQDGGFFDLSQDAA